MALGNGIDMFPGRRVCGAGLTTLFGAGLTTPPSARCSGADLTTPPSARWSARISRPRRPPDVRRGSHDHAVRLSIGLAPKDRRGDLRSARWQGQETLPQQVCQACNAGTCSPITAVLVS